MRELTPKYKLFIWGTYFRNYTCMSMFAIDSQSGEVKISERGIRLRRIPLRIEFDIRATDKGTPEMEGRIVLSMIEVADVNDNPPEIILTSQPTPVREDAPVGTTVALIRAVDVDSGENGKVSCTSSEYLLSMLKPSFSDHYALVT